MSYFHNPYRQQKNEMPERFAPISMSRDQEIGLSRISKCPIAKPTELTNHKMLASRLNVAKVFVKDERTRMGLGSFKALGAAYAIAKQAMAKMEENPDLDPSQSLKGMTFVCASAGNHGLSLAAGARVFGAKAVVYLSHTVPQAFDQLLFDKEADVVRGGDDYDQSLQAAMIAATQNDWTLLSDSSWDGYYEPAKDIMEGYLIMGAEASEQMPQAPTDIFLQAGVGGLAAAATIAARIAWGDTPRIHIVEPDRAPALIDSVRMGKIIETTGPESNMGRLDCKIPSHLTFDTLIREADGFMTITDEEAAAAMASLTEMGLASSPSGAAGIVGAMELKNKAEAPQLSSDSVCLFYLSEGAV